MLGYTTDTRRMRLARRDEATYNALYEIIEQRENLIEKYKNQ